MISTTVSEARATLPALLSRVEAGEEVTLTRHGRPVAVLVRPEALRARRADRAMRAAQDVHDMLEAARHEPLSADGLSPGRADELVRAIRADRDAR
jgi:prevent-host-death family protein